MSLGGQAAAGSAQRKIGRLVVHAAGRFLQNQIPHRHAVTSTPPA
jgi:hypothetical protein